MAGSRKRWSCCAAIWVSLPLLVLAGDKAPPKNAAAPVEPRAKFLDFSLLVATDYPCTWPGGWPLFQINHYQKIGPHSAYNSDILAIDGNTGTQLDFPPHSIPKPGSGLANAGLFGKSFSDRVPAWQFVGEACVIDCRDRLDTTPNGRSDLIKKETVMAWEKKHRAVGTGDVVLFYSGYGDKYYKPLPAGRRFIADPLEGKAPAWPDPDEDCMDYLGKRKVMTLGCDSPSMGPLPDLAEAVHIAGLKYGMIWTEGALGLGKLPATGAFYCCIGPKHVGGPYTEARAFAIVGQPLAARLIESARKKKVVDLSVSMDIDLPVTWPGQGVGNHRQPYLRADIGFAANIGLFHHTHILDSQAGTHLVPPAYALPSKGFDNKTYPANVQDWLAEYEKRYGPRGTSDVTTEKVPIIQTCGPAHVIDVRHLLGTTEKKNGPRSPEITVADIKKHEKRHGDIKAGDIVIFHSGWSDRYFKPLPDGNACLTDPLNGKSEGWPSPGPDAVMYLAEKGIRCLASDAPTLGGVEPRRALMTYWALASKGMVGVEFLTKVGELPANSYFLFAAVKIRGCHGGPGRAIALY